MDRVKSGRASDTSGAVIHSQIIVAARRHHEARGRVASAGELFQATKTYPWYPHDRDRMTEAE